MNGLKFLLIMNKVTNKKLSKEIGCSDPLISYMAKGNRNIADDLAIKIAKYFNVEKSFVVRELSEVDKLEYIKLKVINEYENKGYVEKDERKHLSNNLNNDQDVQEFMETINRLITKEQIKKRLIERIDGDYYDSFNSEVIDIYDIFLKILFNPTSNIVLLRDIVNIIYEYFEDYRRNDKKSDYEFYDNSLNDNFKYNLKSLIWNYERRNTLNTLIGIDDGSNVNGLSTSGAKKEALRTWIELITNN